MDKEEKCYKEELDLIVSIAAIVNKTTELLLI